MKPEALEWTNKLRSGKYKQTTGTLCDSKGYCCLGVAATFSESSPLGGTLYNFPEVTERYGLTCDGFRYSGLSAMDMNDTLGLSFEEIAYLADETLAKELGHDTFGEQDLECLDLLKGQ